MVVITVVIWSYIKEHPEFFIVLSACLFVDKAQWSTAERKEADYIFSATAPTFCPMLLFPPSPPLSFILVFHPTLLPSSLLYLSVHTASTAQLYLSPHSRSFFPAVLQLLLDSDMPSISLSSSFTFKR